MKNRNKWFLSALFILIGAFVFLEIIAHFDLKEIFSQYKSFSLNYLALYIFISLLIVIVLVLRWKYILKSFGYNTSIIHLFSFRMAGHCIGYLTPSAHLGGEPMRAYYLKKKYKIPLSKGVSSILIDRALELSGDVVFALIAFTMLFIGFAIPKSKTIPMIIATAVLATIIISFYYRAFRGKSSASYLLEKTKLVKYAFFKKLNKFVKEIEHNISFFFNKRKRYFLIALFFTLILWVLMYFEYKIALKIVGVDANLETIFLVLLFVALAYVMPIPAAIGSLEAGQVSVFSMLGLSTTKAIAFSFLVRGRDLLWVIYGAIVIFVTQPALLGDFFKNKIKKDIKRKALKNRKK